MNSSERVSFPAMMLGRRCLLSVAFLLSMAGCAGTQMGDIGASVLGSTGYVTQDQAKGLFSAGEHLVKSQRELTPEQEYYLGRAVSAKLLASYHPQSKPALEAYVNKVGTVVAAVSDVPETFGGYHFVVVDSPAMNAVSAPGGFVYISSGFVKMLPSEDALAAVLAHEVAHIVKRHGVNAISNANLFAALTEFSQQSASVAASRVSSPVDLGPVASVFSESVTGVVDTLLNKGFDRKQEYEADLYAVELLQRAGYEPRAMLEVLQLLQAHSASGEDGWFATHPQPEDRTEELQDDFSFPDGGAIPAARTARFKQIVR
jgi:predicted Zn-dependent protease